jgi:hypothetical protein
MLAIDGRLVGFAQPRRRFHQRIQHHLQIERRAADNLEHVGGRRLLLQRFPQFVEQARVLDGDDGLAGEIPHQLDVLVAERLNFLTVYADRPDQLVVLDHRNGEHRAIPGEFDGLDDKRMTTDIRLRRRDVGDLRHLPSGGDAAERHVRRGPDQRVPPEGLDIGGRRVVGGDRAKGIVLAQEQRAELGRADTHGVLQDRLEHRIERSWRT